MKMKATGFLSLAIGLFSIHAHAGSFCQDTKALVALEQAEISKTSTQITPANGDRDCLGKPGGNALSAEQRANLGRSARLLQLQSALNNYCSF